LPRSWPGPAVDCRAILRQECNYTGKAPVGKPAGR
jgi:hypothetical protein